MANLKTFKDVEIGQTFYTRSGNPSKKISEIWAVSLCPQLCGFNFQEAKNDVTFRQSENDHVYGIGTASY